MAPRLPGRSRPAAPPRDPFNLTDPPVKCPTGKRRYQSEATATNHHRVRFGGSIAVPCEECKGYHHERRAPK